VALAPLGAWVAVKAQVELPAVLLSLAVAFWVAGFDVIYALQDVEFDRREGLYSIPAKLGVERALLLSRLFHLVTLLLLVSVGLLLKMGALYYLGLLVSSYFMFKEHSIVARDREKVAFAFFNLNGYISLTVFLFTFLDYLWRALWS
jgi:4-hydroxybenzoate polyprenyltransferase